MYDTEPTSYFLREAGVNLKLSRLKSYICLAMPSNFFTPVEEREKIFCTELVKRGVSYQKAVIAAKILDLISL